MFTRNFYQIPSSGKYYFEIILPKAMFFCLRLGFSNKFKYCFERGMLHRSKADMLPYITNYFTAPEVLTETTKWTSYLSV